MIPQWGVTPSLNLNFLAMNGLDSRITFTRASSGTYFNSAGVLSSAATDAPRFDYDPVTLLPKGLLIEEARTNVLLRSQEFDHAAWSKNAANESVTANAATAPDGTTTADKLVETNSNASHRTLQQFTSTVATWTASVYIKAAENTSVFVGIWDTINERGSLFNLSTGVVTSNETGCTGAIQDVGGGWYRCSTTRALEAADATASMVVYMTSHGSYVGTTGNGLYLWGAQLEAGSFPTSYIATTTASVTRAADVCTRTLGAEYNAAEGTVVIEASAPFLGGAQCLFSLDDGTADERMTCRQDSGDLFTVVNDGGVNQANVGTGTLVAGSVAKAAFTYKVNDLAQSLNGGTVDTDTSATMPTVTSLQIGNRAGSTNFLNGHIRRIRYWRYRLSNNTLRKLSL